MAPDAFGVAEGVEAFHGLLEGGTGALVDLAHGHSPCEDALLVVHGLLGDGLGNQVEELVLGGSFAHTLFDFGDYLIQV